ncbi:MAG: hypothetical protein NT151_10675 [Acidobacteria bacterium]|nr:hypothetical protein [Acidobacteriota bacterium]
MRTNARRALFGRPLRAALLVLAVMAVGMAGGLAAQSGGDTPPGVRPDLQQLKHRVEQRFQVLLLRQGFVLVPKSPLKNVGSIELSDGSVLLDGSPVTGSELKQRVGVDSELIVQLSFLDATVRRQLFESPKPTSPAEPAPQAKGAPKTSEPPEVAAPSDSRSSDDESANRDRHRYGGARVRVGGDIRVRENEEVGNDVVAILGSIYIDGKVNGEVVAVGGGVYLGPKADVRGDVTSVGGGIERSADARVSGQINEVKITIPSVRPYVHFSPWRDWTWWTTPFGASVELVGTLVRIGVIGLLAALIVAVFPVPVQRVSERVAAEPWRAALTGLVAQVLFVPLLVLTVLVLAVSIIGIPLLLLVPFVLVTALAALLLGFTGVGCAIGQKISRRGSGEIRNLIVPLVVGLAIIWALTLVARFVGLAGMPLRVVVGGVLLVGFVVEYVAWTMGLGGVLLSRFGRRGSPRPT